jgi:thiamine biosynthesis lipoprotein
VAEDAGLAAYGAAQRIDSLLSIHRPLSELSSVNKVAGQETTQVSFETFALLEQSLWFHECTEGAFDISIGPLMELWKLRGKGRVPKRAEIDSTLLRVGLDRMILNRTQRSVYIPEGMVLDSGGIAKGYAADLARAALKKHGVTSGMVDLGGNLAVFGPGPSGEGFWRIGIRSPLQRNELIGSFDIRDVGVATSGQYEQYFIRDGKRYGHLLDPRTGLPAQGILSATVIAPDAITTDALSTAVFVLGISGGLELVERLQDVEAIIVLDPGPKEELTQVHVRVSSGLQGKVRWSLPS